MSYYELPIDPPEPKVDGVLRCCECEEIIPGDEWYFEVNGQYFCERCMEEHKHLAPYREEWY